MERPPCIVLFRQDLRTTDNPALYYAAKSGQPVLPLYIYDDVTPDSWVMGGASKVWLHYSLKSLEERLSRLKLTLHIAEGATQETLDRLIQKTKANALYLNHCYEPFWQKEELKIKRELEERGVSCHFYNGSLLFEPDALKPKTATFYKVFTPFYNSCLKMLEKRDLYKEPVTISPYKFPSAKAIEDLKLLPHHPDWSTGIHKAWKPGQEQAHAHLSHFLKKSLSCYSTGRDYPSESAPSKLSPHLHFGEISPMEILHALDEKMLKTPLEQKLLYGKEADQFLREIFWREFAHHILHHFPSLPDSPYATKFDKMPWSENSGHLKAWQQGMTGFPIVDAGQRELWQTGYMHNRVRMVTASFLIKDLLIDWREGEKWFWDTLVDADLASNAFNWQWVAGCGFDAAPYFRIFNPTTQGEKFDPEGAYVRKWVPEIAKLPSQWIHKPQDAPAAILNDAGVTLGKSYPYPIVDHATARVRALDLLKAISD